MKLITINMCAQFAKRSTYSFGIATGKEVRSITNIRVLKDFFTFLDDVYYYKCLFFNPEANLDRASMF